MRLDQGLTQKQAGQKLRANHRTVANWEKGRTAPAARHLPALRRFLGREPEPEPVTFPERLQAVRSRLGLTQRALAAALGIDRSTVQDWEVGRSQPMRRLAMRLEAFLGKISRELQAEAVCGSSEPILLKKVGAPPGQRGAF